ncbi:MAG: hypothetical protein MUF34_06830 [Polyangiaceae bacterium]|jgi:hypothetical protein|nr:hypothetical protein [Polyangiaceae bacterium]
MRRTQGQTRAPIALVWPALVAACLASAGAAQACPSSSSYNTRKAAEERAAALPAADAHGTIECGYKSRRNASSLFGSPALALVAVPTALGAFALGWRSGGRRKFRLFGGASK